LNDKDRVPCDGCILFPICNSKVQEEGVLRTVIIGLSCECPLIENYIREVSDLPKLGWHFGKQPEGYRFRFLTHRINNVRRVYGWNPQDTM